jgi:hypothetical protein
MLAAGSHPFVGHSENVLIWAARIIEAGGCPFNRIRRELAAKSPYLTATCGKRGADRILLTRCPKI